MVWKIGESFETVNNINIAYSTQQQGSVYLSWSTAVDHIILRSPSTEN